MMQISANLSPQMAARCAGVTAWAWKHWDFVFWTFIGLVLSGAFFATKDMAPIADEGANAGQIVRFMEGRFFEPVTTSASPFYHVVMAAIMRSFGGTTVSDARLVSFLVAACTVPVFFLLTQRVWPAERYLRTAQFTFLPILFPYFSLLYTDVWALLFPLVTVERALAGKVRQSAAAGLLAVLLRQPNILWVLFAWFLTFPRTTEPCWNVKVLRRWLQDTWLFPVIFAAFGVFVLWNGGVAFADKKSHTVALNLANVWFFLLVFAALFLPNCLTELRRALPTFRQRPVISAGVAASLLALYVLSYHAHHQYNQKDLWFYLRNRVLHWTTEHYFPKILAFGLIVLAIIYVSRIQLGNGRLRSTIAVSLLAVAFMPLIEQRYYLTPLALLLVFRPTRGTQAETAQLIGSILASVYLFRGVVSHRFFL